MHVESANIDSQWLFQYGKGPQSNWDKHRAVGYALQSLCVGALFITSNGVPHWRFEILQECSSNSNMGT